MSTPPSATGCLTGDDVVALWGDTVAGPERDRLLGHARECEVCTNRLEAAGSQWSLDHLRTGLGPHQGDDTLAIRDRLAQTPPAGGSLPSDANQTAAIPRTVPSLPGIVELQAVGRGGMGIVYRGRDATLDRLVAVKMLVAWAPLSSAARKRAAREALVLARLRHPNVVAIHAAGESDGVPYLVMEWVAGGTLQHRIEANRLPPRAAAELACAIARALEQVHAIGIVHRDIKPANILLAVADDPPRTVTPKLADFGLARPEAATEVLTCADDVLGTPGYMAPEQTGLDPAVGEVGPTTDIHALGGLLFAMLTGEAPFKAATPLESMQRSVRGDVGHPAVFAAAPADLQTIVSKCLQPIPARRYRSAGELADDLERFLDGRPVAARPISAWERLGKWARRRPLAAAAVALTVALVVVAAGGTAYHVSQLGRANEQVTASRDRAEEAMTVAERSMERLTGAAIKRMLFRGEAINEGDLEYLRQVRNEFAEWPLGSDPVAGLWFRTRGLKRVANLCFDIARYADSLACQEGELTALARLSDLLPDDPEVLRARLDTHYRMRYSLYHLERVEDAIASARESIALLEAAPADLPPRERALIDARYHLGVFLQEHGRFAEGAPLTAAALGELVELRTRRPDDIELVVQELNSLYGAQLLAYNGGRHDERRRWLDRLVAVAEHALPQFDVDAKLAPWRSSVVSTYATGLAQLSNIARDEGRLEDALAITRRRGQACRRLIAELDRIDDVHREAIDADLIAASLCGRLGRPEEAAPLLDSALKLAEDLNRQAPAVYDHAILLGRSLFAQGEFSAAAGAPETALRFFTQALTLLEPWLPHKSRSTDAAFLVDSARNRIATLNSLAVDAAPTADTVVNP